MDEYDAYDGYEEEEDVVPLDLVEGTSAYSFDENNIEQIAPPPSSHDNFEDIKLDRLELNGLSDYSTWYTLASPFFKFLAPIQVYHPFSDSTRDILNSNIYNFLELIVFRYICGGSLFFSFEFYLERGFTPEDISQLSLIYDSIIDSLFPAFGLNFFILTSDPVDSVYSRILIFGVLDGPILNLSAFFARVLSVLSEFDDCILKSFKITQDSDYLESFLYFMVSKHQHQWYRYIFFDSDPTFTAFLDSFVVDMQDWLNRYCVLYGEHPYCGKVEVVYKPS